MEKLIAVVSVSVCFCDTNGAIAGAQLERLGLGVVGKQPSPVAGPHFAVQAGGADPQPVDTDRDIVGQPGEAELARIAGRGGEVERQRVAGRDQRVVGRGRGALPGPDRGRSEIVEAGEGIDVPGLHRDDEAEMSACRADLLELRVGDADAGAHVDQHELALQRRSAATAVRQ